MTRPYRDPADTEGVVDSFRTLLVKNLQNRAYFSHYQRVMLLYQGLAVEEDLTVRAIKRPLILLVVSQQGGWAVPRSQPDDDLASERRFVLKEGLHPKWRHRHKNRVDAELCIICEDPVCECGHPAFACRCDEEGQHWTRRSLQGE